jgi:hypothetical protein
MKPAIVVDKAVVQVSDCKDHPKYQALKPPKTDCETCRQIYAMSHPQHKVVNIVVKGQGS